MDFSPANDNSGDDLIRLHVTNTDQLPLLAGLQCFRNGNGDGETPLSGNQSDRIPRLNQNGRFRFLGRADMPQGDDFIGAKRQKHFSPDNLTGSEAIHGTIHKPHFFPDMFFTHQVSAIKRIDGDHHRLPPGHFECDLLGENHTASIQDTDH